VVLATFSATYTAKTSDKTSTYYAYTISSEKYLARKKSSELVITTEPLKI
jgi:hypothetical protein